MSTCRQSQNPKHNGSPHRCMLVSAHKPTYAYIQKRQGDHTIYTVTQANNMKDVVSLSIKRSEQGILCPRIATTMIKWQPPKPSPSRRHDGFFSVLESKQLRRIGIQVKVEKRRPFLVQKKEGWNLGIAAFRQAEHLASGCSLCTYGSIRSKSNSQHAYGVATMKTSRIKMLANHA